MARDEPAHVDSARYGIAAAVFTVPHHFVCSGSLPRVQERAHFVCAVLKIVAESGQGSIFGNHARPTRKSVCGWIFYKFHDRVPIQGITHELFFIDVNG